MIYESFTRGSGASDHSDDDLRNVRFCVLLGECDMSVDSDFIYDAKERQICGRETKEDTEMLANWARLIKAHPAIEVPEDVERQGCDAPSR